MMPWEQVTAAGNTFVGLTSLVEIRAPSFAALKSYDWDRNTYLSGEVQYSPLAVVAGKDDVANGWQQWREKAGFDANGSYTAGRPKGTSVFVRPNQYEPGRGHVIVYNWDQKESVEVDVKGLLKPGQAYRIVSAQNVFGEPIVRAKYEGKPVILPMKAISPAQPTGFTGPKLPVTEPEFGVFVVLPE
jgi:hypothetical protein